MATQTQTSPARIGGSPGKSTTVHSAPVGDSVAVTKRLQSELMSLMASADPGVSAFPDGDSLFSWLGTIQGAGSTVYDGLSYKLSLKFPLGMRETLCWPCHMAHTINKAPLLRAPLPGVCVSWRRHQGAGIQRACARLQRLAHMKAFLLLCLAVLAVFYTGCMSGY